MKDLITRNGQKNVTSFDDAISTDFGIDGIYANIGEEFSYTIPTIDVFQINNGVGVIQSRKFKIVDGTNEQINLNPTTGSTVYWYLIYAEIDLRDSENQTFSIESTYLTGQYPITPNSDDLRVNPNGRAYMPLYTFKQTSGGVIEVLQKFRKISPGEIANADNSTKTNYSYQQSDGTIIFKKFIRKYYCKNNICW